MSKVKALYHIVFCTKMRDISIPPQHEEDLYRFIWSLIKANGCRLIRIGGIANHVHILLELHPAISLSALMKTIKGTTSAWMLRDERFPLFKGWAKDYYASTISARECSRVVEYIKGQKDHHRAHTVDNEFANMYRLSDMTYDERDMTV